MGSVTRFYLSEKDKATTTKNTLQEGKKSTDKGKYIVKAVQINYSNKLVQRLKDKIVELITTIINSKGINMKM